MSMRGIDATDNWTEQDCSQRFHMARQIDALEKELQKKKMQEATADRLACLPSAAGVPQHAAVPLTTVVEALQSEVTFKMKMDIIRRVVSLELRQFIISAGSAQQYIFRIEKRWTCSRV